MVLRHMVLSGESWIWTQSVSTPRCFLSHLEGQTVHPGVLLPALISQLLWRHGRAYVFILLLLSFWDNTLPPPVSPYNLFSWNFEWSPYLCWKCFPIFVYPFINEEVTGSWVFVQYSLKLSSLAYWVSVCLLASMSMVRVVHNLKTVRFEWLHGKSEIFLILKTEITTMKASIWTD